MKKFLLSLIGLIITGLGALYYFSEIRPNTKVIPFETGMNDTLSVDTTFYAPTIEEILLEREEWRKSKEIDSIYLALDERILIYILHQYGTSLWYQEIVAKYIKDKAFYDNIVQAMQLEEQYYHTKREDIDTAAFKNLKIISPNPTPHDAEN